MAWGYITSVFFLATVKFMFAPAAGRGFGLPFWETYFACFAGGTFGAFIFYYGSELIIKFTHKRKIAKHAELERKGIAIVEKKKFTKTNRFVIKIKRSLGIYGICFWAPFLLSVPLGSIIVAKFYGKLKKTFPLIILGMAINATVTCLIAYIF